MPRMQGAPVHRGDRALVSGVLCPEGVGCICGLDVGGATDGEEAKGGGTGRAEGAGDVDEEGGEGF